MAANDNGRLIVLGASSGGVEALTTVVRAFPRDLDAAVAVVLHVAPSGTSVLPAILSRAGAMPARPAVDGEPVEAGRIYVAPPDHHLIVEDRTLALRHGPRENGHRPAVDPLFMTAAAEYGPRVIGVILSGTLDDGAAGLAAIKAHGGIAVVQDPKDATHPGMPASALERATADHVVALTALGPLLVELCGHTTPEDLVTGPHAVPPDQPRETPGELDAGQSMRAGDAAGLSCPECGGSLWYVADSGGGARYRCRIGHAYSEQSLVDVQGRSLEIALWTALRALEERAALLRRMAHRARDGGHRATADGFLARAAELDERAATIREHIVPAAIVGSDVEATGGQ